MAANSPTIIDYEFRNLRQYICTYHDVERMTAAANDAGDAPVFFGRLGERFRNTKEVKLRATPQGASEEAGAASSMAAAPVAQGTTAVPATLQHTVASAAAAIINIVTESPQVAAAGSAPAPACEPTKRPPPSPAGSERFVKVARTSEIELGTIGSPAASLILSHGRLLLRGHNSCSTNIPSKTVIARTVEGKFLPPWTVEATFQRPASWNDWPPWSFSNAATALVVNTSGKVDTLAEFCDTTERKILAGHVRRVSGTWDRTGDVRTFEARDVAWQRAITMARGFTQVLVLFIVTCVGDEVIPLGVALATARPLIIKAGVDLVLH